jgi:hypothetical protein
MGLMYWAQTTDEQNISGMIIGKRKSKSWKKYLPPCNYVHHKSHMNYPGIEHRPPWLEAGNYPPELWHGLCSPKIFHLWKHTKNKQLNLYQPICTQMTALRKQETLTLEMPVKLSLIWNCVTNILIVLVINYSISVDKFNYVWSTLFSGMWCHVVQ